ncbi:MAG: hypothetical protein LBR05_07430 [Azoarcus sp.]|jgi:hypothetical protein|nr:hypothetical protein [Azoarcus sp.]
MNTRHLALLQGGRRDSLPTSRSPKIGHAISNAIHLGYRIGRPVRIGQVDGAIVGYNIGHFGLFSGKDYPLLVRTRYGITKCSLSEVEVAAVAA